MTEKKEDEAPDWGDRADSVRKLTKGKDSVWVDKGSDTEAKYLEDGWKGEGAGSKKPSEAPEPPQSGDRSEAFAQELSTAPPSTATTPTSEPGLPAPPEPLEPKPPTVMTRNKPGPKPKVK